MRAVLLLPDLLPPTKALAVLTLLSLLVGRPSSDPLAALEGSPVAENH